MNTVNITGNLSRDPELRKTAEGTSVVEMGVAVNERVNNDGAWENRASFFEVVVFGNRADAAARYLKKGSWVVVKGKLKQERWTDQATGANRSKVKIIASEVEWPPAADKKPEGESIYAEEIPF